MKRFNPPPRPPSPPPPACGDFCRLLITFVNSLEPDQVQQNVGPDLDPNCLTLWWYSWQIQTTTKHAKLPSMQIVKGERIHIHGTVIDVDNMWYGGDDKFDNNSSGPTWWWIYHGDSSTVILITVHEILVVFIIRYIMLMMTMTTTMMMMMMASVHLMFTTVVLWCLFMMDQVCHW